MTRELRGPSPLYLGTIRHQDTRQCRMNGDSMFHVGDEESPSASGRSPLDDPVAPTPVAHFLFFLFSVLGLVSRANGLATSVKKG